MPQESFLYLGDTARLPYGTKSATSVSRYASRASAGLVERGVKMLVIACNTASAVALPDLREQFAPMPVVGVVEPGAQAAVPHGRRHLVLATEATVRLAAYRNALQAIQPDAVIEEMACELMVSLAEEGWVDDDISRKVVRRYIGLAGDFGPDTVILGCTHFPLLVPALRDVIPKHVHIVDSAHTTAAVVRERLLDLRLQSVGDVPGSLRLFATDGPGRFARVGGRFLGEALDAADIEVIDL